MKLSRRCFLSFAIGGAAGTALTPMPWKLMDDVSIWTQNWPWTPVPMDGSTTNVNSTCTLCPGGCGITVRKIDERAIKIEGIAGHPVNDGGICMLGLSGLQLLYNPLRVKTPLKRVGERGQHQWLPISWKAAIAEVVAKLSAIRAQGKPQSLACIAPRDTGTVPQLLQRLVNAFGSPNFLRMPSMQDSYEAALYLTQGATGTVGLDVEHADFILSFGSGILEGYGSPVRMFRANSQWKDTHATLVQIEPRLSNTAAKADAWLPVKPGRETDLALAMAQVIIERRLYHRGFVAQNVEGFKAFTQMVQKYTPTTIAADIGIDVQTITETAMLFASAKKPLALFGKGKGQTPGSLKEALAVHALNALVGNINQKGGVLDLAAYDYIKWPDMQIDKIAAAGLQTRRLDGAGTDAYPHARYLLNRLPEAIDTAANGIHALLVAEANPCYTLPGCGAFKALLEKIPYVVSFSSFMDETAMNADLILPNHLYLERYEDVPVTAGVTKPIIGLCRPVVQPQGNTQHLGDTIIQIAQSLGGLVASSFPWKDYKTCLQTSLSGLTPRLIQNGFAFIADPLLSGQDSYFQTPSGRFELMNHTLASIFKADDAGAEGDPNEYPLTLIPADSIRLASRYVSDPPFMVKALSDTVLKGQDGFVDIHPQTAANLNLKEGQHALLTTPKGQAEVRVHLSQGVMPDVVVMPRGLGHKAIDPYLAGKGANINELIGPVEDPASGLDAAWGIRAKLVKA